MPSLAVISHLQWGKFTERLWKISKIRCMSLVSHLSFLVSWDTSSMKEIINQEIPSSFVSLKSLPLIYMVTVLVLSQDLKKYFNHLWKAVCLMVKSMASRTKKLGSHPYHRFSDLQQIIWTLCSSVFSYIEWEGNRIYIIYLLWKLNKLTYIKSWSDGEFVI